MSKWFNKRKVSVLNLRPPVRQAGGGDAGEFEQLFYLAFKCFRLFALTPGQMPLQKGRYTVRSTRWMMVIVLVLVLTAWFALVETFFIESRTALITGIANHIQFLTNTIALSAAWIVPQLKANELGAILDGFLTIDQELSAYSVLEHVAASKRVAFLIRFGTVLAGLAALTLYDAYVSFVQLGTMEVWYWLSHQLPFIVYAMGFLHAYVIISWLQARFRQLNKLVEQYHRQGHIFTRHATIVFSAHIKLDERVPAQQEDLPSIGRREHSNDLQVLAIVSRTIDLGQKIEAYFGPLFLTVYTALFSVTTIQLYYCYLHLNSKPDQGLSIESLVQSGAIIICNVIAIVALPYKCEQVESESKLLMSYLSKLSMKHGQTLAQHSSIWFPNLISSVRFSALGFFTINYNMLSGLVAGMVTYLIIFIQFNSMVPAGKDDTHQSRRSTRE